jgi:signal transduction histidine kinase
MHVGTKDTGTGVGLFVARSVAEAHSGDLAIDSAPGGGTHVQLTLPVPD